LRIKTKETKFGTLLLDAGVQENRFDWFEAMTSATVMRQPMAKHQTAEQCYEILKLKNGEPLADARRAYHRLALSHHPDRGQILANV
jgi:DnaJ-class molecular chaperone